MSKGVQLTALQQHGVTVVFANPDGTVPPSEAEKFARGGGADSWYCIAPRDIELHPDCWNMLIAASRRRPDIGIFYSDCVAQFPGSDSAGLFLKPEWDLTLLLADDYVGLPLFITSKAAGLIGAIDSTRASAAAFDLLLRAHASGVAIGRIPEVMARYAAEPVAALATDRRQSIEEWQYSSAKQYDVSPGLTSTSLRFDRRFLDGVPDVTLVIPTRQALSPAEGPGERRSFIVNFLDSLADSAYPMERLHVLIGDDVESDAVYVGRSWPFAVRRVLTQRAAGESFNYAAKLNQLWRGREPSMWC